MNRILIILVAAFCLISCQGTEHKINDTSPTMVNLAESIKKSKPTKKFKDIFEITNVIKLQSEKNSFIATLSRLVFVKDKIFVVDKKYTSIKVFDEEGGFLKDIVKIGQGPGEFTKIFDAEYFQSDNSILVYSNDDMKFGSFDLDGKLIYEKRIPFYAYYFTKINKDSTFFFVNYNSGEYNDENNLLLTDDNFKILDKYFPYKRNFAVSSSGSLIKSNEGIFYNDAYVGDIYQFKNNRFNLLYKVNLGKYQLPIESTQTFSSVAKTSLDYAYFGKISTKTNDCLIFDFMYNRRTNIGIYFDDSNQTYISTDFEKNDIYHIISPPKVKDDDANTFYAVISPTTLGYISSNPKFFEDLQENYPELYPYLKNLKDIDNPIIVLFKRLTK